VHCNAYNCYFDKRTAKLEDSMPVKIYEQSASFTTKQVVPVPIGDDIPSCYPQVRLLVTDETVEQTIPIIWMENEFIRLAIAPSLGGRIIAITDLRTSIDVIPLPTQIDLIEDEFRGAHWSHGIEFVAGLNRSNSLGPIDFRVMEAGTPEDKGALFLFEWTGDLSWHSAITLYPDRAAFLIEQNVFNRRWTSIVGDGGVDWTNMSDGLVSVNSCLVSQNSDRAGLYMSWVPGDLTSKSSSLVDGNSSMRIGGHRTDAIRREFTVYSGQAPLLNSNHLIAAFMNNDQLFIQPQQAIENTKIFLSVGGQTLEARFATELGKTSTTELISLPGGIDAISIRNDRLETIFAWPKVEEIATLPIHESRAAVYDELIADAIPPYRAFLRNPGLEPFCYWMEAVEAVKDDEFTKAEELMEKYLGFNAEDPLGWWFKSSIRRESGKAKEDDARELPNAHYLAPLEPVLRAEAFLNTPIAEGREPNPLLAQLAVNPDHAAGVVGTYLECHLIQGMARLADELLRHRDNAMVRYLLAFALLEYAKNETAAGEQVMLASKLAIEPPFPHRMVELMAVNQLADTFTGDQRLSTLRGVMERAVKNLG